MGNYVKASGKRHGGKTAIVILSVIAVLLAAMVVAGVFVAMRYHIIDAKLYAKDTEALDLRGQEIRRSHFDKLREKMPGIEIRWDIPFQGGILADDVQEITLTTLSKKDIEMLAYARQLKTVNA